MARKTLAIFFKKLLYLLTNKFVIKNIHNLTWSNQKIGPKYI